MAYNTLSDKLDSKSETVLPVQQDIGCAILPSTIQHDNLILIDNRNLVVVELVPLFFQRSIFESLRGKGGLLHPADVMAAVCGCALVCYDA